MVRNIITLFEMNENGSNLSIGKLLLAHCMRVAIEKCYIKNVLIFLQECTLILLIIAKQK